MDGALHRPEVSLRERAARSGLQMASETPRWLRVTKLDGHDERPRTMADGDAGRTGVVPPAAALDVTGEADAVSVRIDVAAEDVDEAS